MKKILLFSCLVSLILIGCTLNNIKEESKLEGSWLSEDEKSFIVIKDNEIYVHHDDFVLNDADILSIDESDGKTVISGLVGDLEFDTVISVNKDYIEYWYSDTKSIKLYEYTGKYNLYDYYKLYDSLQEIDVLKNKSSEDLYEELLKRNVNYIYNSEIKIETLDNELHHIKLLGRTSNNLGDYDIEIYLDKDWNITELSKWRINERE